MADQLLNLVISTGEPFEPTFCEWFRKKFQINGKEQTTTLEEFGIFFLNFIRQQTEEFTKTAGTPKCVSSTPVGKTDTNQQRDSSGTRTPKRLFTNDLSANEKQRYKDDQDSLYLKCTPTRNTSLLNETLNQSHLKGNTSTPHKSFNKSGHSFNSSYEFNRSSNSTFCLGDFIVASPRTKKKQQQQKDSTAANLSDGSNSDSKAKKSEKPKKRVVPTKISQSNMGSTTTSFNNPAFCSENNILKMSNNVEIVDREKCAVLEARKSLKTNMLEISKELQEENRPNLINRSLREAVKRMENLGLEENEDRVDAKVDFNRVTHRNILERFADIHSFLIDAHITTNVLSELSYLLGILNIDNSSPRSLTPQISIDGESQSDEKFNMVNRPSNEAYTALNTLTNCIFFAIEVLRRQKHLLALLDVKTLRIILNNERISELCPDLKTFLDKVTTDKQQLEVTKSSHEAAFRISKTFNNVFYQQENDTRNNFPSDREFSSFKSQRDLFYTIFKTWDANHLSHMWNFKTELSLKIQMCFNISDHPINMAHLAKLFVSQLLVSSTYNETSPTDIGVELKAHVDLQKFNKLTQRLVEPSNFSIDYQFPAKQAFFKDFLLASTCLAFNEQVKIALLAELLQFNDSTFDVINLTTDENYDFVTEYVVRPEILSTMQVLAKFIGLLQSQPFIYTPAIGCNSIDKKQIELRNMLQPSFDVMRLLKLAVTERKLLITIPWMVQYLAMLDHITLQLDYYRNTLHLMYELYICLGGKTDVLKMRPTSKFILMTCLGWFFEGTNVAASYYVYRQNRVFSLSNLVEMKEVSILVPNAIALEMVQGDDKPMVVKSSQNISKNGVLITLEQGTKVTDANWNQFTLEKDFGKFDPMLECVLNVACPFLSEFRVAIMPAKYSKCVSRSGRYRHVTPKISDIATSQSPKQQPPQDSQSKLIEAFLHSQNLSVRRTIEFVIERTTSAVIKDAQIKILLPSKDEANKSVQEIQSNDPLKVKKIILQTFSQAHVKAMEKWDAEIPIMVESRVKRALDALLPNETQEVVKKTCLVLILQKCQLKINDWRTTNLKNIDFYVKDINATVDKIVKANMLNKKVFSTNLEIVSDSPCLSEVLEELQLLLHITSRRPELVSVEKITFFIRELPRTFVNVLPQSFYRIIGSSVVHLIQNLIEHSSYIVTSDLISDCIVVWKSKGMHEFTHWECTTPEKNESDNQNMHIAAEREGAPDQKSMSPNLFSSLVTISFVRCLKRDESFDKLELLLLKLVEHNLITIDHLNELFVRIFKVEWNEKVLSRISALLQTVSASRKKPANDDDDGRSNLFMEVLADFSRDVDLF